MLFLHNDGETSVGAYLLAGPAGVTIRVTLAGTLSSGYDVSSPIWCNSPLLVAAAAALPRGGGLALRVHLLGHGTGLGAGFSGLAGALFAMAQTSAFPDVMSLHYSGYVVMMTLVGGGLVSFWGR